MRTRLLRPLSLGEVLDTAFSLYRELFVSLVFIAVVTQTAGLALDIYIERAGGLGEHPLLAVTYFLIASVGGSIGTAASTFLIADNYLGRRMEAREGLRKAMPFIGQVLVLSLLTTLLVGLGLVLLIVPGVILLCGLSVGTQALVLESHHSATTAMARSWTLTKGSRWKIFLAILVLLLLLVIPGMALLFLTGWAEADGSGAMIQLVGILLTSVLQLLVYPFFYVVMTVLYYDLRVRREGYDLEMLASSLSPA